jgi:hypothetical protein
LSKVLTESIICTEWRTDPKDSKPHRSTAIIALYSHGSQRNEIQEPSNSNYLTNYRFDSTILSVEFKAQFRAIADRDDQTGASKMAIRNKFLIEERYLGFRFSCSYSPVEALCVMCEHFHVLP